MTLNVTVEQLLVKIGAQAMQLDHADAQVAARDERIAALEAENAALRAQLPEAEPTAPMREEQESGA